MVFFIEVRPLVSNLFATRTAAETASDTTIRLIWKTLIPILYHVQYTPGNAGSYPDWNGDLIHGQPAVSASTAVISMGLMMLL